MSGISTSTKTLKFYKLILLDLISCLLFSSPLYLPNCFVTFHFHPKNSFITFPSSQTKTYKCMNYLNLTPPSVTLCTQNPCSSLSFSAYFYSISSFTLSDSYSCKFPNTVSTPPFTYLPAHPGE